MAAKIQDTFSDAKVELIGGGRGDFIVKVDGAELWNKKQMGNEFPQEETLIRQINAKS